MEVRSYDVIKILALKPFTRDASGDFVPTEQALVNSIPKLMVRHSWVRYGGAGVLDYYPFTWRLVVNQTPDVHRRIEKLLRALEEEAVRDNPDR